MDIIHGQDIHSLEFCAHFQSLRSDLCLIRSRDLIMLVSTDIEVSWRVSMKICSFQDHPRGKSLSEEQLRGNTTIKVLTDEEIEGMLVSTRLGREVLDEAARVCDVGVTTDEIDRAVHEACIERECYPSPLNYYNFPKSCCTSVNEVICHGIPDLRPLQDGDLCNVDVTVYHRGFHGDLNETFFVGNVAAHHKKLVQVTYESLAKAIEIVKPGERYREIGNVIEKHVRAHGFSVVRSYCGHGIHRLFHTAPNVPHYASKSPFLSFKSSLPFIISSYLTRKQRRWCNESRTLLHNRTHD